MDIGIHIDHAGEWWQGYVTLNGEKHYPTQSKHLEKFIYNCFRLMVGQLKDKIFALAEKLVK